MRLFTPVERLLTLMPDSAHGRSALFLRPEPSSDTWKDCTANGIQEQGDLADDIARVLATFFRQSVFHKSAEN